MNKLQQQSSSSALHELRLKLPHGVLGRRINSYIFVSHPLAIEWQRSFRQQIWDAKTTKSLVLWSLPSTISEKRWHDHGATSDRILLCEVDVRSGFGFLFLCAICKTELQLDVQNEVLWKNLSISNKYATGFDGDIAIGFGIPIDQCTCYKDIVHVAEPGDDY